MKKSLRMGEFILVSFLLVTPAYAQNNIPSEDELLDFDALDRGEQPATNGAKTTPVPMPTLEPQIQQTPPPAPAPVAEPEKFEPPTEQIQPAPEPPQAQTTESIESAPGATSALETGEANAQFEARLARIYQKYNQSEISDDEWSKIAGPRMDEKYSLQGGDNLWDISTKFFGNGFYWPKVWQLNDDITNPHNVKVGKTLKFSPGSTLEPPKLSVDENEPEIENLPTAQSDTGELPSQEIVIPRARKKREVLTKIPPSFPDWGQQRGDYDKNGFSKEILVRYNLNKSVTSPVPSIITDKPWASSGKVVEMEGGLTVASTYQYIILQISGSAATGSLYTVFSNNGEVEDDIDDTTVGYEMQTRAVVEIVEPIVGAQDTYRALVKNTVLPVRIGDHVVPGELIVKTDYEVNGAQSNVSARVVNGEWGKRKLFGLHNTVFLNRGEQDGLQAGQLLPVIKNVRLRNSDSVVGFDTKPIGTLKVVHTSQQVSTAVVVVENDSIIPGDETATVAANSAYINNESGPEPDVPTTEPAGQEPSDQIEPVE